MAAEVNHLEDRLDEMKERLELWVLRAASELIDPSGLRGLVHLAQAAEEIGDAAQQMVWLVEQGEELHPILAMALGEADEVVVRVPVGRGSAADGASLAQLQLETETGFYLLAIRRGGRYFYRPRKAIVLADFVDGLDGQVGIAVDVGNRVTRIKLLVARRSRDPRRPPASRPQTSTRRT